MYDLKIGVIYRWGSDYKLMENIKMNDKHNIEGLNEVESKWVEDAMKYIIDGKTLPGECLSEKAWDKYQTILVNMDIQKEIIPF